MPDHRSLRLIAILAGLAGALLCGLVPLLPVNQTTAAINWPQGVGADGYVHDVTAPLVSGAPRAIDVNIPCRAVASLPDSGGLVFATIPPAGIDASRNGIFVRANADTVVVAFRDTVAAVAPRAAVESGACSTLHVWGDPAGVGADFVGIPGATGTLPADKKPQVAGLFTELRVPVEPGLSARVDIDTRFVTTPTMLKRAAMALGVIRAAYHVSGDVEIGKYYYEDLVGKRDLPAQAATSPGFIFVGAATNYSNVNMLAISLALAARDGDKVEPAAPEDAAPAVSEPSASPARPSHFPPGMSFE